MTWPAIVVIVLILIMLFYYIGGESYVSEAGLHAKPTISYFTKYHGLDKIVVILHYTNWCAYCQQIQPVWAEIKKELASNPSITNVIMLENNEDVNKTFGIDRYPTILKYVNGRCLRYKGYANYDQLRTWILNTRMYYDVPTEIPL